jgi:hypothetical protein
MNKSKVATGIFCISILANLITGCDNSKAANNDNFKKAIAVRMRGERLNCFNLGNILHIQGGKLETLVDFPLELKKGEGVGEIQVLTKVGMLLASQATVTVIDSIDSFNFGTTQVSGVRYTLTKDGEKIFRRGWSPDNSSRVNGFCVGEAEVDKIINFTEPQNQNGTTISKVKFTYKVKNLPSWISNSEIQAAFPETVEMVQSQNKPLEANTTLFLTSKGWAAKL